MIKIKFNSFIQAAFFWLAVLITSYFVFANIINTNIHSLINSDTAYLPLLYKDLIIQKNPLYMWAIPQINYLFPDVILYFILYAIFSNLYYVVIFFGLIQIFAYVFLCGFIGSIISQNNEVKKLFYLIALFSLVLVAFHQLGDQLLNVIVVMVWHFGITLTCFASLAFLCQILKRDNIWLSILFYCVVFLAAFSDVMYIPQFVVPAIITLSVCLIFNILDRKHCLIHLIMLGIVSGQGHVLSINFPFAIISMFPGDSRIHHFVDIIQLFLKQKFILANFYRTNTIIALCYTGFVLTVVIIFIHTIIVRLMRKMNFFTKHPLYFFILTLLMLSTFVGLVAIGQYDHDLYYNDYMYLRHYQFFILASLFVGIPILIVSFTDAYKILTKPLVYNTILFILCFCMFMFLPKFSMNKFLNYRPKNLICLDNYAKMYHWHNGIGLYMQGKSFTMLSRQKLNFVSMYKSQLSKNIYAHNWIDTFSRYRRDYDFVLLYKSYRITRKDIIRRFGKPSRVMRCDDLQVFVYDNKVIDPFKNDPWEKRIQKTFLKKQ